MKATGLRGIILRCKRNMMDGARAHSRGKVIRAHFKSIYVLPPAKAVAKRAEPLFLDHIQFARQKFCCLFEAGGSVTPCNPRTACSIGTGLQPTHRTRVGGGRQRVRLSCHRGLQQK